MRKAVIVTGANSGLGFETTKQIAQREPDYQLIMACRNMSKAEAAREEIIKDVPSADILCLELDTSSLAKVRTFVEEFRKLDMPLYGLVCNAGVAGRSVHETADGFNNIFETNYLGHFLLTQLLLPMMTTDGRIVTVSSDRHDAPKGITWPGADVLAHPGKNPRADQLSYSYSKLCMILFAYELDRQLTAAGQPLAVNTVNPGLMIETGLAKDKSRFTPKMLEHYADIIATAADSAKMIVNLMFDSEFATGSARYFDLRSNHPIASSDLSYDKKVARELWDYSMDAVGLNK
ncbi:SDR family NAD(P)-dependent oxidoreductase [Secundilactobacillus folii]|uniref:SDR family NAD(P)-dependent oxidoreductase n=1 Tax=Secundilactobacillus folii TaxID=2678357 RepID=A0A7X2XW60_9LACO|nr:SDR family NAD(P)-dependent oxidoreductase [Secundilactobacillus folii]MTV82734.1 SDR family NAD(P)-dependent oxidoreductase [Secundilactobacillus folii]